MIYGICTMYMLYIAYSIYAICYANEEEAEKEIGQGREMYLRCQYKRNVPQMPL